jgi:hypothetical protein
VNEELAKGLIKVVWIEKDLDEIYSRMFDDEKAAERFGRTKKDFVVFRLLWQRNLKEFGWVILPYGKQRLYKTFLKIYKAVN